MLRPSWREGYIGPCYLFMDGRQPSSARCEGLKWSRPAFFKPVRDETSEIAHVGSWKAEPGSDKEYSRVFTVTFQEGWTPGWHCWLVQQCLPFPREYVTAFVPQSTQAEPGNQKRRDERMPGRAWEREEAEMRECQAEPGGTHSQAEPGNEKKRGTVRIGYTQCSIRYPVSVRPEITVTKWDQRRFVGAQHAAPVLARRLHRTVLPIHGRTLTVDRPR
jgi:hypothetical protein